MLDHDETARRMRQLADPEVCTGCGETHPPSKAYVFAPLVEQLRDHRSLIGYEDHLSIAGILENAGFQLDRSESMVRDLQNMAEDMHGMLDEGSDTLDECADALARLRRRVTKDAIVITCLCVMNLITILASMAR